jgi:hypothetical protein
MKDKATYEKPDVEIVEFVLEDSIAESVNTSGAWFNETIWGS